MIVVFEDNTQKEIHSIDDIQLIPATGIYMLVDGKPFKNLILSYHDLAILSLHTGIFDKKTFWRPYENKS